MNKASSTVHLRLLLSRNLPLLFVSGLLIIGVVRMFLWVVANPFPVGYDARSYIAAAHAITQGYSPYLSSTWTVVDIPVTTSKYLYPPLLAILFTPLTALPFVTATYICVLFAVLSAITYVILLRQELGWRYAILAVLYFPPTWQTIYLGQINLLIAIILLLAMRAYPGQSGSRFGFYIALGTLLKITPVVLCPLLIRRSLRSGMYTFIGVVIFSVLLTVPFVALSDWWSGGLYALQQRWSTPELVSWTGIFAHYGGYRGEIAGLCFSLLFGILTLYRLRYIPPTYAFAALIFLPLLIARITWEHHTVMVLPALVALWIKPDNNRLLAGSVWLLISVIGGLATPFALTLGWIGCCWPESTRSKILQAYQFLTTRLSALAA